MGELIRLDKNILNGEEFFEIMSYSCKYVNRQNIHKMIKLGYVNLVWVYNKFTHTMLFDNYNMSPPQSLEKHITIDEYAELLHSSELYNLRMKKQFSNIDQLLSKTIDRKIIYNKEKIISKIDANSEILIDKYISQLKQFLSQ